MYFHLKYSHLLLAIILPVLILVYPQPILAKSKAYYDQRIEEISGRCDQDHSKCAKDLLDLWLEMPRDEKAHRWLVFVVEKDIESLAGRSDQPYPTFVLGYIKYWYGSGKFADAQAAKAKRDWHTYRFYEKRAARDLQVALKCLKETVDIFPASAEMLGEMYEEGKGVTQSKYVAIDYYYKAGLAWLELDSRERTLTMLEKMNALDANHPLTKKLSGIMYSEKADNRDKEAIVDQVSAGTGWVCRYGYIVTNYHVIKGRKELTVLIDKKKHGAKMAIKDEVNDLALLEIEDPESLPAAIPLTSSRMDIAADVFTVGFPHPSIMGVSPKFSSGKISSLTGIGDDPRIYQISVPLQSGNSGGPLININGEAIAVVTYKLDAVKMFQWTGDLPQNVNYGIKIQYLKALLDSVRPAKILPTLPVKKATLQELVKRVESSIVLITAQ